jgi:hypothetical protein
MNFRRNVHWVIGVGVTCLFLLILLPFLFRHEHNFSPIVSPSQLTNNRPDSENDARVTQSLAVPPDESVLKEDPVSESPAPAQEVPPPDEGAVEVHRTITAGLNTKLREATKGLYTDAFKQLHLPADLQEKVIDILMQEQKQLEQQAFEAAQAGTLPALPSPAEVRAQQAQQDQQLRSVLGDAGFAQFNQYRATIPDRSMIDSMNQQGANLNESQSQQLLKILTDARQQIIGQAGITQNWDSMSPDKAVTIMQQQQVLLQEAVANRVQNMLTPKQASTLQGVLSQQGIGPNTR